MSLYAEKKKASAQARDPLLADATNGKLWSEDAKRLDRAAAFFSAAMLAATTPLS